MRRQGKSQVEWDADGIRSMITRRETMVIRWDDVCEVHGLVSVTDTVDDLQLMLVSPCGTLRISSRMPRFMDLVDAIAENFPTFDDEAFGTLLGVRPATHAMLWRKIEQVPFALPRQSGPVSLSSSGAVPQSRRV